MLKLHFDAGRGLISSAHSLLENGSVRHLI